MLEALLLREELPDELDRLEPEELERDPELERLELLLPEDELQGGNFQLMPTNTNHRRPSTF